MDRVMRCLQCGKRMVPIPGPNGCTELKWVFCDKLDPVKIARGKAMGRQPACRYYFEASRINELAGSNPS